MSDLSNLAPNTIVGRLGSGVPGPAQAVPFSTIATQLAALIGSGSGFIGFNVKNFGAVGDGNNDDTSAINAAIAAFNLAGAGQLYFPAGNYKVTASLTTITAKGIIFGDGTGYSPVSGVTSAATTITFTSTSTALFTSNSHYLTFQFMAFIASQLATTGCIALSLPNYGGSATSGDRINVRNCTFIGFYDVIVYTIGNQWYIDSCDINNWVHYGIHINNALATDAGGWYITNTTLNGQGTALTTAGIRIETGGGDHIVNTNILNCGIAIDLIPAATTQDLLIANCSIENIGTFGIHVDCTISPWSNLMLTNVEFFDIGTTPIDILPGNSLGWIFAGLSGANVKFHGSPPFGVTILPIANSGANPISGANSSQFNDCTGGIGGAQFLNYNTLFSPSFTALSWDLAAEVIIAAHTTQNGRSARLRAVNNTPNFAELAIDTSANRFVGGDGPFIVASDSNVVTGGSDPVYINVGGTGSAQTVAEFTSLGSTVLSSRGRLAANATDGFLYIPTCSGTPTGTPTSFSGGVPMIYDTANNKFYIYNSGWKGGTNPGTFS